MRKDFTNKYLERSIRPNEYTKKIDCTDFIKYDSNNLWKSSYDVMTQHVPKIEDNENEKNEISPILLKRQAEAEKKEYYDPLKRYAQRAEDEGSNIERNPLNNHKLIMNSYFPMSRLIGSYWDKIDRCSYFQNKYDKIDFDPEQRESGYTTNLQGNIDFTRMFPGQKGSNTDTEYRVNFWKEKGFQWRRLTEEKKN